MKKLSLMLLVGLLVIGAFAAVASAEPIEGATGGAWEDVFNEDGSVATEAIVFRVGEGMDEKCNITPRTVNVDVRAFVAQWAHWKLDFNGWEWYVKKPGIYYADCIAGRLQSNGQVTLSFTGFDNLKRDSNEQGTNDTITMRFGYSQGSDHGRISWEDAGSLTEFVFEDNTALHAGFNWKLWNEINVVECNSPGLYTMSGFITLTLDNQAVWVDDESGGFDWTYFSVDNGYTGLGDGAQ